MPAEPILDGVASAIAILLDVPVVLISVIHDKRQVFVGAHGVANDDADDVSPLSLEVATLNRPVLMQDARRHLVEGACDLRGVALFSYMGLPIAGDGGACLGAVSAFREHDRTWRGRDLVVLREFAELLGELLRRPRFARAS